MFKYLEPSSDQILVMQRDVLLVFWLPWRRGETQILVMQRDVLVEDFGCLGDEGREECKQKPSGGGCRAAGERKAELGELEDRGRIAETERHSSEHQRTGSIQRS